MKLWKLIILLTLLPLQSILCQDTLNIDQNTSSDIPSFKPDEDIISNSTNDYGWFPFKFKHIFTVGLYSNSSSIYFGGTNIQSPEFGLGNTTFTHKDPFDDNKEKKISKAGEINKNESSYPSADYSDIGLALSYYTPLPISFTIAATYGYNNSILLYSEDKTKNYLKSDGEKGKLREVTALFLDNSSINISAGMMIDLWGGAMSSQSTIVFSSYYLYLGGRYNYFLTNNATAFTQIANADDEIRYTNLCDTIQHYENRRLNNMNNTSYFDLGLGVNFGGAESLTNSMFNGMVFDFRLILGIPYNSLFTDTSYKSWHLGLEVHWGLSF